MSYQILQGDCRQRLAELPARSVQTCVTSPPYFGLRDYGHADQIGLEQTPAKFVAELVSVFEEVHRVLKDDGTVWLNLGDSYANDTKWGGYTGGKHAAALHGTDAIGRGKRITGLKAKDLIGIPWRVAFALQDAGWYLRQDIVWHKPNPMPESVTDRCTKAHEYMFLLSKRPKYYFDHKAIQESAIGGQHPAALQFGRTGLSGQHILPGQSAAQHRPRVNEADRKELRTDTENRHRSSIPGGQSLKTERPQLRRAYELAEEHGLTEAHIDAIRACGLGDTGKNRQTQTGTGRNSIEQQRLADEAKEKLGGYYREFLLAETRNKRSVWTVATQPYSEAHFATFPPELIRPCILAGSRPGDVVLDPFAGSGTTLAVALEEGRQALGIELNPAYLPLIHKRLGKVQTKLQFHHLA